MTTIYNYIIYESKYEIYQTVQCKNNVQFEPFLKLFECFDNIFWGEELTE